MNVIARLERVAEELAWLGDAVMFFGAGVLPLYLDRDEVRDDLPRPTEDVDALVRMASAVAKDIPGMESELRRRGWKPDLRRHRRNLHAYIGPGGIPVDFVFDVAYPPEDWPVFALRTRERRTLPSGRAVTVPSPALYLVCKLAASRNEARWEGAYESHDLEDVALLLAGCSALAESVGACPSAARDYLRTWAVEVREAETVYGSRAYACLEGNWPRSVPVEQLDEWLVALASDE